MNEHDDAAYPLWFGGARDHYIYENREGLVKSLCPRWNIDWAGLWSKHLEGRQRLGLYPTGPDNRCGFGCLDLDAHGPGDVSRWADASAVVEVLDSQSITAYWHASRRGRGAHVFLFFEPPGPPAEDLHAFLAAMREPLTGYGQVDLRPEAGRGNGGAVFLPYFGGADPLLDSFHKCVALSDLEKNDPVCIPAAAARQPPSCEWPPKAWGMGHGPSSSKNAVVFQTVLHELQEAGLLFRGGSGELQARKGGRARLAGAIAVQIFRRGGTLRDFYAWDRENAPPLASDEPKTLDEWWRYAEKKFGKK